MLFDCANDYNHAIVEDDVHVVDYRSYFDTQSWLLVLAAVKDKKRLKSKLVYKCLVCRTAIGKSAAVICDSCLQWQHMECAGFSKALPKSRHVFCHGCRR